MNTLLENAILVLSFKKNEEFLIIITPMQNEAKITAFLLPSSLQYLKNFLNGKFEIYDYPCERGTYVP